MRLKGGNGRFKDVPAAAHDGNRGSMYAQLIRYLVPNAWTSSCQQRHLPLQHVSLEGGLHCHAFLWMWVPVEKKARFFVFFVTLEMAKDEIKTYLQGNMRIGVDFGSRQSRILIVSWELRGPLQSPRITWSNTWKWKLTEAIVEIPANICCHVFIILLRVTLHIEGVNTAFQRDYIVLVVNIIFLLLIII